MDAVQKTLLTLPIKLPSIETEIYFKLHVMDLLILIKGHNVEHGFNQQENHSCQAQKICTMNLTQSNVLTLVDIVILLTPTLHSRNYRGAV